MIPNLGRLCTEQESIPLGLLTSMIRARNHVVILYRVAGGLASCDRLHRYLRLIVYRN